MNMEEKDIREETGATGPAEGEIGAAPPPRDRLGGGWRLSPLRRSILQVLSAALILAAAMILLFGIPRQARDPEPDQTPAGFDPAAYVDGFMKQNYLGEFDPGYLTTVGLSEAGAEAAYENGIHMEIDRFLYVYGVEYPTDELEEELEGLFKDFFSRTRYRVLSTQEGEDGGYTVEMEVEPLDLVLQAETAREEASKAFYEKYPADLLNAMSDEKYRRADEEWARLIVDLYQNALEKAQYQDPVPITLRLEVDEGGYYSVNSEDFDALDQAVLTYEVEVPVPAATPQPTESAPAAAQDGESGASPSPAA